jgi:hypothetical protein
MTSYSPNREYKINELASSYVSDKLKRNRFNKTGPIDKGFIALKSAEPSRRRSMIEPLSAGASPTFERNKDKKKRKIPESQLDAMIRKEKLSLLVFTKQDYKAMNNYI